MLRSLKGLCFAFVVYKPAYIEQDIILFAEASNPIWILPPPHGAYFRGTIAHVLPSALVSSSPNKNFDNMQPPPPRPARSSRGNPSVNKQLPDRMVNTATSTRFRKTTAIQTMSISQQPPSNQSISHAPRPWHDCFDEKIDVSLPLRSGTWRVYKAGMTKDPSFALIFLHGGGHSALSWALVSESLKPRVPIIAFDARGHGNSSSDNDADLSANTQVLDAVALLEKVFEDCSQMPKLVLCGHSMGGAIAVHLAASRKLSTVVGLVVIDVVEGTAISALPFMSSWLQSRSSSFSSVEKAVRYVTKAGHVRNVASARLSVPPQVVYSENVRRWTWRTRLENSEKYWRGWFEGLSSLFLSVPAAKMLVLANVDRLDKDLMIAQMQGKFQNILIPAAGHTVHEDQPDHTAQVLLDYLERNLFLPRSGSNGEREIFQQRRPIPPCC